MIDDLLLQKAKNIKCLISDVDGVLTDGSLYFDAHGNELKMFNVQDGMGLKLLMSAGIHVAIITTATTAIIDHRMKQLGVKHYFKGCIDKRNAFETLKKELHLTNEMCAYIGDDLPDIPIIQQVAIGIAVSNALIDVKESACFVTQKEGGRGAVREVCDILLKAQEKQKMALEHYLAS